MTALFGLHSLSPTIRYPCCVLLTIRQNQYSSELGCALIIRVKSSHTAPPPPSAPPSPYRPSTAPHLLTLLPVPTPYNPPPDSICPSPSHRDPNCILKENSTNPPFIRRRKPYESIN